VKVISRPIDTTKFIAGQIVFILFLICLFAVNSYAQTRKSEPCPTIQYVNPPYEVEAGKPVTLTVKVSGLAANVSVTYNWAISGGTIVSGQGTEKISIDTKDAEGSTITATVEVSGLSPTCNSISSHTLSVLEKKKPAMLKIYEGKYVSNAELEKQIDELVLARIVTEGKGYIIFYAGQKAVGGEVKRLTEVAKAQIKKNKVDATLFVIIEGGRRDATSFELWAAGIGADPPQPNPNK
jgi:hypothetical protein